MNARHFSAFTRLATLAAIALAMPSGSRAAEAADPAESRDVGDAFELPPGFSIRPFAADELAHDIYSMTIDPRGRVVVSGAGYIRTLADDDGDGRADRAVEFATCKTGAQGLCFVDNDLVFTGDGMLGVYRDRDGNGRADGPAEKWLALDGGEHGAHAIVHGPDGWLYVVVGNDAGLSASANTVATPLVPRPECGGILRISRDGKQREIIAHGFRNPYDLACTPSGQWLTVDSDGERAQYLPWYEPTRLFDVALGRHHGWVEDGWQNSWSRPAWFFDNTPRVAELGRGSPTGMECYQHRQFPARYCEGVFSCCWTLGRVYFCPLEVTLGAALQSKPEIFLRPKGSAGFAPVDLAVGLTGELFVASGGRGTAGSVYAIEYHGPHSELSRAGDKERPTDDLLAVLEAPQPLAAWSRRQWEPIADRLGLAAFAAEARDRSVSAVQRARAFEVMFDRFDAVDRAAVEDVLEDFPAPAAERAIWAVARVRPGWASEIISPERPRQVDPFIGGNTVVRDAWEAAAELTVCPREPLLTAIGSEAPRIQATATFALARMLRRSNGVEQEFLVQVPPLIRLMAEVLADPSREIEFAEVSTLVARTFDSKQRNNEAAPLAVLRLLQLALGDLVSRTGDGGNWVGYQVRYLDRARPEALDTLAARLAGEFPTECRELDLEISRTMACLGREQPDLLDAIARQWTDDSSVPDDLHYLMVAARLPGVRSEFARRKTAAALTALHGKLRRDGALASRSWPEWVGLLYDELAVRDPALNEALLDDEKFGEPDHSLFAARMFGPLRESACAKLLARCRELPAEEWTPELVDVLATTDAPAALEAMRPLTDEPALRGAVLRALARNPEEIDRDLFREALGDVDEDHVRRASDALRELGASDDRQTTLAALFGFVRVARLVTVGGTAQTPAEELALNRLVESAAPALQSLDALMAASTKTGPAMAKGALDRARIAAAIDHWRRELEPVLSADERERLEPSTGPAWHERLQQVDWSNGDVGRGHVAFERRLCARCHGSRQRIGPSLVGAAARFSREDLFAAIFEPSAQVAPVYRTTIIATRAGQVHHGLVVYESPEGTLLQTSAETTVRITGEELARQFPGTQSLMPSGLLDGATSGELADLYAYLRSLVP